MSAPNDDDEPRAHPYRTPTEVNLEQPPSSRAPKAKLLSALAAISAASGAGDLSETLSRRAADARGRETTDDLESARDLRRKARVAFEEEQWTIAEALYRRVIALLRDGAYAPVLDDVIALATTLRHRQRWDESEALFRRATASREALRDEAPIVAVHDLAVLFLHLGRIDDARCILERALERANAVESERPSAAASREVARIHHALAECALDDADVLVARRHVDRALELRVELDGPETPIFGATLATAARVLHVAGERDAAKTSFWRAIDLMKTRTGHTLASAQARARVADLLADQGRLEAAEDAVDEAIAAMRGVDPDHAILSRALRIRARIHRLAGRHAEAAEGEARVARIVEAWCG
jgi:tetratricopeptide (TPR) repeat protein